MTNYKIAALTESPAGLSLCVETGGDEHTLLISRELWTWGRPAVGTLLTGEIYAEMEHAADLSRARARMRSVLSYASCSRGALIEKLRHYEFSEEICAETADYAVEHGLIREGEQAVHAAETYLRRKYWGRKRILMELRARGYSDEAVEDALSAIPPEEFGRALRAIIERKYGTPPTDPGERQKMVLSLLRLGYSGSEIKEAIEEMR